MQSSLPGAMLHHASLTVELISSELPVLSKFFSTPKSQFQASAVFLGSSGDKSTIIHRQGQDKDQVRLE